MGQLQVVHKTGLRRLLQVHLQRTLHVFLALKLKVSRSRLIELLDKSPPSFEDGRERLEGQVLHPLFDDPLLSGFCFFIDKIFQIRKIVERKL